MNDLISHEVENYSYVIDKETEQGFKLRHSGSRPLCDLVDALHSWA